MDLCLVVSTQPSFVPPMHSYGPGSPPPGSSFPPQPFSPHIGPPYMAPSTSQDVPGFPGYPRSIIIQRDPAEARNSQAPEITSEMFRKLMSDTDVRSDFIDGLHKDPRFLNAIERAAQNAVNHSEENDESSEYVGDFGDQEEEELAQGQVDDLTGELALFPFTPSLRFSLSCLPLFYFLPPYPPLARALHRYRLLALALSPSQTHVTLFSLLPSLQATNSKKATSTGSVLKTSCALRSKAPKPSNC